MELMWFQYVVGYDKQEQRSLATSLHNQIFDYARLLTRVLTAIRNVFTPNVLLFIIGVVAIALGVTLIFFGKRLWQFVRRRTGRGAIEDGRGYSNVEFYQKLTALMEKRGLLRDVGQTPLEFAGKLQSSEAMVITRAYNRVRFGNERLSAAERKEVERALFALETAERHG
jgi:hypothetical protein